LATRLAAPPTVSGLDKVTVIAVGAVAGLIGWCATVHVCLRLWGRGRTALLPLPTVHGGEAAEPLPREVRRERAGGDSSAAAAERTVLVTGGSGLVGASILRHLLGTADTAGASSPPRARRFRYRVVSLDRQTPPRWSPRFVAGVEYVEGDLVILGVAGMGALLRLHRADAVVHTAGVVQLRDDEGLLLNVNFGATLALLLACRTEAPSVRAFVLTSSASVVNDGKAHARLLRPQDPPPDPLAEPRRFSTHYARSKALAEAATLAASAGRKSGAPSAASPVGSSVRGSGAPWAGWASSPCPGFHTCALRLPGVYALGDPWMFGPLSKGELAVLPGNARARVEMVYAENAAYAHALAVDRLLSEAADDDGCGDGGSGDRGDRGHNDGDDEGSAGGFAARAFVSPAAAAARRGELAAASCRGAVLHVTNGEPDWPMGAFVAAAREKFQLQQPSGPPKPLPAWCSFVMVRLIELAWWACAGCVPCKAHPAWDFTRAALGYMDHDGTLDTGGCEERLGYRPLFGVQASLDHIHRRWLAQQAQEKLT